MRKIKQLVGEIGCRLVSLRVRQLEEDVDDVNQKLEILTQLRPFLPLPRKEIERKFRSYPSEMVKAVLDDLEIR